MMSVSLRKCKKLVVLSDEASVLSTFPVKLS